MLCFLVQLLLVIHLKPSIWTRSYSKFWGCCRLLKERPEADQATNFNFCPNLSPSTTWFCKNMMSHMAEKLWVLLLLCVVRSRNFVLGIQIKIRSRCDRVATTFVKLLFHLGIRIFNGSFGTVIIWKENWTQNYLCLKKKYRFVAVYIWCMALQQKNT